jgi:Cu(I)/Ag(I) efflux system membrane protein CusA/SilA
MAPGSRRRHRDHGAGQNALAVSRAIEQRLAAVRQGLPAGVDIVTTYDRSTWIWNTLKQFFATLVADWSSSPW